MYEVIEVLINEFPFLVMLTELLAIILQKVCLEFVLVKEVIPFIDYRLEPAATDGFGFLWSLSSLKFCSRLFLGLA